MLDTTASSQSDTQLLQSEIEVMGESLGKQFHSIKNIIFHLTSLWKEYINIYGKEDYVDLMNQSASYFFYINQRLTINEITLLLAKLTYHEGKTYPYLTIQRLPALTRRSFREEAQELVSIAVEKASFAMDWRDRQLAHYSLDLVINDKARPLEERTSQEIDEAVLALKKIPVFYYEKYLGSSLMEICTPIHGTNALLRRLEYARQYEEEYRDRLAGG